MKIKNRKLIFATILLIFAMIFGFFAKENKIQYVLPNIVSILANPERYNNSSVSITGYINNYPKLYISQEIAGFRGAGGIYIQDSIDGNRILNSSCLDKYVSIVGKFKIGTKAKQHYDLLLTNIDKIFYMENEQLVQCYNSSKNTIELEEKLKTEEKFKEFLEKNNNQ